MLVPEQDVVRRIIFDVNHDSADGLVAWRRDEQGQVKIIPPGDFLIDKSLKGRIDAPGPDGVRFASKASMVVHKILQECKTLNGAEETHRLDAILSRTRSNVREGYVKFADAPAEDGILMRRAADQFVDLIVHEKMDTMRYAYALSAAVKERPPEGAKERYIRNHVTLDHTPPEPKPERVKKTHVGRLHDRPKRPYIHHPAKQIEPDEARRKYDVLLAKVLKNLNIERQELVGMNHEMQLVPESIFEHGGVNNVIHHQMLNKGIHDRLHELVDHVARSRGLSLNHAGRSNWVTMGEYAAMVDTSGREYDPKAPLPPRGR